MIQIDPQIYIPLGRNIEDPADTATYYIRAYIYDGSDMASLLETVDLESKGTGIYNKSWQTPVDKTGQGRFLTVLYRVYTDAAYTTESQLYGRTVEQYIVKQGYSFALGGGGGADLDYKRVRQIVSEEIKKIPPPEPTPAVNLKPLVASLQDIKTLIGSIDIPRPEKADYGPIIRGLDDLSGSFSIALGAFSRENQVKFDEHKKILDEADFRSVSADLSANSDQLLSRIKDFFLTDIDKISNAVLDLKTFLQKMPYVVVGKNSTLAEQPKTARDRHYAVMLGKK